MFNNSHALNCLFRVHAINLLPRRGRHVLKFALMVAKESLTTLSDQPHHPKARFAFLKRSFGKSKPVLYYAQSRWLSSCPFLHCTGQRRSRCCVLLHEFSALAVSFLEFLHAFDLSESSSYSLLSCATVRCYTHEL